DSAEVVYSPIFKVAVLTTSPGDTATASMVMENDSPAAMREKTQVLSAAGAGELEAYSSTSGSRSSTTTFCTAKSLLLVTVTVYLRVSPTDTLVLSTVLIMSTAIGRTVIVTTAV